MGLAHLEFASSGALERPGSLSPAQLLPQPGSQWPTAPPRPCVPLVSGACSMGSLAPASQGEGLVPPSCTLEEGREIEGTPVEVASDLSILASLSLAGSVCPSGVNLPGVGLGPAVGKGEAVAPGELEELQYIFLGSPELLEGGSL